MVKKLIAALLFACAAAAHGAPYYHVALDTTALSGQTGWLDFLFTGLAGSVPATATVQGLADAGAFATGDVTGSPAAGIVLGNGAGWNEYGQRVPLGGRFEFDVAFDLAAGTGPGTTLSIALLDDGFGYLAGGDLVSFTLQPGEPVGVAFDARFATVTAVPEPAALAQLAFGLVTMGIVLRRRRSDRSWGLARGR